MTCCTMPAHNNALLWNQGKVIKKQIYPILICLWEPLRTIESANALSVLLVVDIGIIDRFLCT